MLSQRALVDTLTIAGAVTNLVQGETGSLIGMKSLTAEANFAYGSGGTNLKVWIQTSLDGGVNWIDIMCFAFTTTAGRKVMTVLMAAIAAAIVPTDAALADDTTRDGVLGDRLRAKVTTTGTYAGTTTLAVNIVPKGA